MAVLIHDTAEVSARARIGDGTKIWNQAQVCADAVIGENCVLGKDVYIDRGVPVGNRVKIQNHVNVYHGVVIEDDVFLGPSMTFTNDLYPRAFSTDWKVYETKVKKGASVGANAVIVCGTVIGRYAMIGAGSVVTKDVADYALVSGSPAKQTGWVCRCGQRLAGTVQAPEREVPEWEFLEQEFLEQEFSEQEFYCAACGARYVLQEKGVLKEKQNE